MTKVLNEIIVEATDNGVPLSNTLRKFLILAFELKNDRLKAWVESELNGYKEDAELPDYRKAHLHSKGNFQGPMGAWMPGRPLPTSVLKKEHRELINPTRLTEPVAAYEQAKSAPPGRGELAMNWSPDLIAAYQDKFYRGYVLAQAWHELPIGIVASILDSVRNRMLTFALELREELGHVADDVHELPQEKVEQAITTIIFGGNNVIAGSAKNFAQVGSINIGTGDLGALVEALRTLGIAQADIEEATASLIEEGKPSGSLLGSRVADWVKNVGGKLGSAGAKIGAGAAQALITAWMLQYWGLK